MAVAFYLWIVVANILLLICLWHWWLYESQYTHQPKHLIYNCLAAIFWPLALPLGIAILVLLP